MKFCSWNELLRCFDFNNEKIPVINNVKRKADGLP